MERTSKLISALKEKEHMHKHKWEILSETTTESPMEQFRRLGGRDIKTATSSDTVDLFRKKYIQILTCECGEIKRFVEEI